MKNELKTKSLGSNRALLLVGLMIIFMAVMPFASAMDFSHYKNYDSNTQTVTVNDWMPFTGGELGKAKLITPEIYTVPIGYQKVAEFNIEDLRNDSSGLGNITFYNINSEMAQINRPFDYKIKTYYNIEIPTYSTSCSDYINENGTTSSNCSTVQNGKVIQQIENWTNLNSLDGLNGTIGVFTNVNYGDKVEWIPNIFGVNVNEWAVYQASTWVNGTQNSTANIIKSSSFNTQNNNLNLLGTGVGNGSNGGLINLTVTFPNAVNTVNTSFIYTNISLFAQSDPSFGTSGAVSVGAKLRITNTTGSFNDYLLFAQENIAPFSCGTYGSKTITGRTNTTAVTIPGNDKIFNVTVISWDNGACNPATQGWNISFNVTQVYFANSTGGFIVNITNVPLTVNLNSPANASASSQTTTPFSCSQTSNIASNLTNNTLSIWNSTGSLILTNTTIISGISNQTTNIITLPYDGTFQWNCNAVDVFNNNVSAPANFTFLFDRVAPTIIFNSPINVVNMTSAANVTLNTTVTDSGSGVSVCLYSHNGGTTNSSLPSCTSASITIPALGNNTVTIYANDSAGNIAVNSSKYYAMPTLGLCNASISTAIVNYTFIDETTNLNINGTISSSSWQYWFDTQNINRTYTYSNTTHNPSYNICEIPAFGTETVIPAISYASTQGATYPTRTYSPLTVTQALTNGTTNVSLYLLSSSNGQFVSFEVVNPSLTAISGADVSATATIGGNQVVVDHKTTDASGLATLWLSPTSTYAITFIKSGYLTQTLNIAPAQTSYTVIMGTVASTNATDYSNGLNYSINPIHTYLNNDTNYIFNFSVASPNYLITSFGYTMLNDVGNIIATNSSATNGGIISTNISTGSNNTFIMNAWWIMNSTSGTPLNNNVTRVWTIINTANTQWSIAHFLTDLNNYTASSNGGFLGLTPNGEALLIFLIIFISAGSLTYGFGIYSPGAVAILIAAETAFFDAGLNLIPSPTLVNPVAHFATVVMGIIAAIIAIKEGTSF